MKRILLAFISTAFLGGVSFGQAAEIGVLAGGIFTSDATNNTTPTQTLHSPSRISFEGIVAARVFNAHIAQLHLELPVVGTPTRTLEANPPSCATGSSGTLCSPSLNFSTVFVTPGLRLSAHLPFFSPFVSAGGGFAHYSGSSTVDSSTVAAFQVGGGVDLSTPIPLIGFRAEVREFHTGTANFNVGQNNLFAGAGLVLKF